MYEIHKVFQQRFILENFSVLNYLLFTALSIFGSSLSYLTEEEVYTSMPSSAEAEEFVP